MWRRVSGDWAWDWAVPVCAHSVAHSAHPRHGHLRCAIHTPREPYVMDMDRQCLMITHSLADTEGRRHFYFYGHRLKPACCTNVTGRDRFAFTLL